MFDWKFWCFEHNLYTVPSKLIWIMWASKCQCKNKKRKILHNNVSILAVFECTNPGKCKMNCPELDTMFDIQNEDSMDSNTGNHKLNSEWIFKIPCLCGKQRKLYMYYCKAMLLLTSHSKYYKKKIIQLIEHHPPYSPVLAPYDHYLLPELEQYLKGKRHATKVSPNFPKSNVVGVKSIRIFLAMTLFKLSRTLITLVSF